LQKITESKTIDIDKKQQVLWGSWAEPVKTTTITEEIKTTNYRNWQIKQQTKNTDRDNWWKNSNISTQEITQFSRWGAKKLESKLYENKGNPHLSQSEKNTYWDNWYLKKTVVTSPSENRIIKYSKPDENGNVTYKINDGQSWTYNPQQTQEQKKE
jgi:hypothetical protein